MDSHTIGLFFSGASTLVAVLAVLAMHFMRGPNKQTDDLRDELNRQRSDLDKQRSDLDKCYRDVAALAARVAEAHHSKSDVNRIVDGIQAQIERLQTTMDKTLEMLRHARFWPARPE